MGCDNKQSQLLRLVGLNQWMDFLWEEVSELMALTSGQKAYLALLDKSLWPSVPLGDSASLTSVVVSSVPSLKEIWDGNFCFPMSS